MSLPLEEGYRSAMQKLALGEREGAIRLLQELARQAPEDTRFHMALEAALAARHRAMRTEMSSASTQELMADPVMTDDGHTYERSEIAKLFAARGPPYKVRGSPFRETAFLLSRDLS